MSKFKVGDLIRSLENDIDISVGDVFTIDEVDDDSVFFIDRAGEYRCRSIVDYELSHASFSPNDTVRMKSGEPFTTGSYTAEVDSTKGDIVLLKHGSWLPVEAVEKVEAKPQRYKVGDRFDYTNGEPWLGLTVEDVTINSLGDATYHATNKHGDRGGFSESMMVPAAEPAAETEAESDFDPAAQPAAVTLSIAGVSVEGSPEAIADLLRALAA